MGWSEWKNFGGLEAELLWENSSPASTFASQTITIAEMVNYDYVGIECMYSVSKQSNACPLKLIPTIKDANITDPSTQHYAMGTDTLKGMQTEENVSSAQTTSRPVRVAYDKIYFGQGSYNNSPTVYAYNNDNCIPYRVWGFKTVEIAYK